mmetsp:Transcript_113699/g.276115  ORF Transcript_113699/g.276115 Transcript_113699/m.276115 type:complete len:85 (-) Transcript_113699:84-338(-)
MTRISTQLRAEIAKLKHQLDKFKRRQVISRSLSTEFADKHGCSNPMEATGSQLKPILNPTSSLYAPLSIARTDPGGPHGLLGLS